MKTKIHSMILLVVNSTAQRHPNVGPVFTPSQSTAIAVDVKNGGKVESVVMHSDGMAHFGHNFFKLAGEAGIDMSKHVDTNGSISPKLRNFLNKLLAKNGPAQVLKTKSKANKA
jgi:hypothetical protein